MLKLNRQRGTTLILITHDHELAALADRRIALRDGRVVSDSSNSSDGGETTGEGTTRGGAGGDDGGEAFEMVTEPPQQRQGRR
jgi:putative ABC transport system ATP-binding protein